jgi:NADH-quinone oxidoreductase subunit L
MELPWIARNLWLIPFLPLLAAGITALMKKEQRKAAAALVIGAMALSFLLSLCALAATMKHPTSSHGSEAALSTQHSALSTPAPHDSVNHMAVNFDWLQFGDSEEGLLRLGFVLDPLTAVMVVMVSLVGGLIFVYSVGYMSHDENFTRFFTFLSLFASAMLGLVMANNLVLLFVCWELVGLASYLLIGFWYFKPSAAEAAKKAFITTKLGDLGFFIGILLLYHQSGTLLLYDNGNGALEAAALGKMAGTVLWGGLAASTICALLIFCGAVGKSGQLPLHVWLPDAMEGPTPVSALIHAATMVAAGVFLVARVYPLFEAGDNSFALTIVAYGGAFTALFAAIVAVAQRDIKRILAYSTVSQLGYMMLALGVGGYVAGMFHLLTHAFFKALLFLGSGSVIHGCHEEQDVFKMGGLKNKMPVTFWTYLIGMLALAGIFPLAGFWSKDEILLDAWNWHRLLPFCFGLVGAGLTAFYMWRQVCLVFFGKPRAHGAEHAHESPKVMTIPLVVLAIGSAFVGFIGFPGANWLHGFLAPGHEAHHFSMAVAVSGTIVALGGIAIAYVLYGRKPLQAGEADPLARMLGPLYVIIENKFYFDELYEGVFVRFMHWWGKAVEVLDRIINFLVDLVGWIGVALSWLDQLIDDFVVNNGFDGVCESTRISGGIFARLQSGLMTGYLRVLALGTILLFVIFVLVM